jgi:hypothetical protein
MLLSGEWWLDESGAATFADGDVGDTNHETEAFHAGLGIDIDDIRELDKANVDIGANGINWEEVANVWIAENLGDDYIEPDNWTDPTFLADVRAAGAVLECMKPFMALWGDDFESKCTKDDVIQTLSFAYLVDKGANLEFLTWLWGSAQGDAREYAIEHMGWTRVKGDNLQLWQFTDEALAAIRDSDVWENVDDDIELELSDETVNIEEVKSGAYFEVPARVLFNLSLNAAAVKKYGMRAAGGSGDGGGAVDADDAPGFSAYNPPRDASHEYIARFLNLMALSSVGGHLTTIWGLDRVGWATHERGQPIDPHMISEQMAESVVAEAAEHLGLTMDELIKAIDPGGSLHDAFEVEFQKVYRAQTAKKTKEDGKMVAAWFKKRDAATGANPPVKPRPAGCFDRAELKMGRKVEGEHTDNRAKRDRIARQHLTEDPRYYSKLKRAGLAPELNPRKHRHGAR